MKWQRALIVGSGVLVAACAAGDAGGPEPVAEAALAQAPAASPIVTEADIPSDIHRNDSWARLPLPTRDALDEDGQRAYDAIINPESRYANGPRGPVAMWLYSPLMAEHMFPASTYSALRHGQRSTADRAGDPGDRAGSAESVRVERARAARAERRPRAGDHRRGQAPSGTGWADARTGRPRAPHRAVPREKCSPTSASARRRSRVPVSCSVTRASWTWPG